MIIADDAVKANGHGDVSMRWIFKLGLTPRWNRPLEQVSTVVDSPSVPVLPNPPKQLPKPGRHRARGGRVRRLPTRV